MRSLNEFHTDIKFTYESSKESIAFLDLKLSVKDSKIIADLYVKYIDRQQYLHYLPARPNHTKRPVVCSIALNISRLCSYEENVMKHKANMKSWFLKREYPEKLISDKVKFFNIERKSNSKTQRGVPLVVTYTLFLNHSVASLIVIFIYYIWIKKLRGHLVHNPWFLIGVRVNSYLVRAKFYPKERRVGSCKLNGKGCAVCKNVLRYV